MGFTAVIKMMLEAKKPIIGHNMIYDAAFIYNQFIDKLPNSYIEFSTKWRLAFPSLFDTKVLACDAGKFGKTDLSHLFYKCTQDKKFSNNLMF